MYCILNVLEIFICSYSYYRFVCYNIKNFY